MRSHNLIPTESQQFPTPRARLILEFIEGDLSRPPIIYPIITAGSDEQDEALRREILRRWNRG